jgi:mevalonate kinase
MTHFPAKIILFGEYTLLSGSKGLAMPFDAFYGNWAYDSSLEYETKKQSSETIIQLAKYVRNKKFNAEFQQHTLFTKLNNGLYFESNIPQGYGLGSSGALVAAIYTNFFTSKENLNLLQIKSDLALLESYFHGSSSGTDPLVSYVNKPILLDANQSKTLDFTLPKALFFFLIDTQVSAKTQGLVSYYQNLIIDDRHKNDLETLIKLTNQSIESLFTDNISTELLMELAMHQQLLLKPMFIANDDITNAQKYFKNQLVLKLCGSGGGGFLMGIASSKLKLDLISYFDSKNIRFIPIN